jgi:ribosome-associated heat shock protein Hsp15
MERHRLDHWLKLVCLFKHRADATDACNGGHVKLNGQRAKPAAAVRQGDAVEIVGDGRYRRVVVQGLPERTISKEESRTMYLDDTPKVEPQFAGERGRERGSGRPTKKERRDIEKWRR